MAQKRNGHKPSLMLAGHRHMVRQGLRSLLEQRAACEVIAEVEDGLSAVAQALRLRPDVIVLDAALPRLDGVEATRRIKRKSPTMHALVFGHKPDRDLARRAHEAGAAGFIHSADPFERCLAVLRTLTVGANHTHGDRAVPKGRTPTCQLIATPHSPALTPRERQVLRLLTEGHRRHEIASQLNIGVKTVDTYRYKLMQKTNLQGMAQLTRFALREGITTLDA